MFYSAIGKIIGAGAFAVPVFKVAYENIAIRKEKGTMTATLPIVEISDIAVTKMFGFRPIDIDRRSLQRAFIIATEIDVAGLVEITAQLVEGIVLEIPSVDVAAKFAGWSRLIPTHDSQMVPGSELAMYPQEGAERLVASAKASSW